MPALDAVAAEVREWYGGYVDTFTSLAAGQRTDLEAVLGFYGVPLVIVADGRHLALPDRGAVLGTAQSLIDQLITLNYASSTIHRLDVRALNARAGFIEGVFSATTARGRNSSGSAPPTWWPRPTRAGGSRRSFSPRPNGCPPLILHESPKHHSQYSPSIKRLRFPRPISSNAASPWACDQITVETADSAPHASSTARSSASIARP